MDVDATARRAAKRLGLTFEHRRTGFGDLATAIGAITASVSPGRRRRGDPAHARLTLPATPTIAATL